VQLPGQEGESRGHGQLESKRKAYVTLIFTGKYIVHGDSDPFIYKNRRAASLKNNEREVFQGVVLKGIDVKPDVFWSNKESDSFSPGSLNIHTVIFRLHEMYILRQLPNIPNNDCVASQRS